MGQVQAHANRYWCARLATFLFSLHSKSRAVQCQGKLLPAQDVGLRCHSGTGDTEHGNRNSKAALGKKEFGRLVRRTISGREVPDLEVDLLYRVFDKNRDGFLNLAEVVWSENKLHNDCSRSKP